MWVAKTIKAITFLLPLLLLAETIAIAESKCISSIVIKNAPGDSQFGKLYKKFPDRPPVSITPRALAVDSKDNIYVGDSVNYRVLKFSSQGKFLFEIKLQAPAKSTKPEFGYEIQHIGIDGTDNVYVWNSFEDRVEAYDSTGRYIRSIYSVEELKGILAKTTKLNFRDYSINIDSNTLILKDGNKIISKCIGAEIDHDEDGLIYTFDNSGNILTFDGYSNVVRIKPVK